MTLSTFDTQGFGVYSVRIKLLRARKRFLVALSSFWAIAIAASIITICKLSLSDKDKFALLLQSVSSTHVTIDAIEDWQIHGPMVYAYTARCPLDLEGLRAALSHDGWIEGNGRDAITYSAQPIYPGWFDPGGMGGASLYMKSSDSGTEMWAFDNRRVFFRRRIGTHKLPFRGTN